MAQQVKDWVVTPELIGFNQKVEPEHQGVSQIYATKMLRILTLENNIEILLEITKRGIR